MFVKFLPYYQICTGCCMKFMRTFSCEKAPSQDQIASDNSEQCNNNNNCANEENGHSKEIEVNGIDHFHNSSENSPTTNHDRTQVKENVFEKTIRQPPEFIRICCWCFVRRENESLSPSPDSSPINQAKVETPFNSADEVTNVVLPLDGGTVYTPMKNFIGRELEVDDECLVIEELEQKDIEQHANDELPDDVVESPRSSSTGETDERLTNCCSTASTASHLELADENEENNNNSGRQQVGTHAHKQDLDQRPKLSPSKSHGNGSNNNTIQHTYNNNGRFFGAETIESPYRSRFLGEQENESAAAVGAINHESYIIHRDEQYDSENDEKSSNDSTSTRIISNSTFNFGSKGSDPYPPTPNISHPPSILSSRPQSVTSHKSIGSGILKNDGRLSRTSNISYSNMSIKQSSDNVSIKSTRSAKSRENTTWYEREGTPIRSEDVISSNQVNYESDYDDEVEEEAVHQQRIATPKRYPTPSPHPLQSSYSTEELSNNSYQAEEIEATHPKSRVQSASLSNLQHFPDEEKPSQPAPAKKILRKPFLVRKSSKVAPIKDVVSGIKAKNKMNEVIFQKTLRKFDKPKDALSNCITHLESPNWEQNISGLQIFVRLIRHHPDVIDNQIHLLSVALAKQVRNLRSQVARAACQASAEFFSTHRRSLEGEAEDIATHLLHRTADTNKFLRADANQALESMCENLSNSKVIHIIAFKGATHQNAVVRTTAAKLLDKIVHQIGSDKVFTMPKESREKLVLTGAQLLLEGSLDTRNYTKSMFKQLSEHPSYNKVLLEVIPPRTYRNIEKTLKSIRQM